MYYSLSSVVADDQRGYDGEVVAHFNRDHLRLNGAPRLFGTGKDVINLFFRIFDAEGEIACSAIEPLACEQPDDWVVGRGVEVAGQYDGMCCIGKIIKYERSLSRATDAVEGLKMSACKHDGIAIRKDKGAFEQSPLLHARIGMRQLDVVHIDKLMPSEQTDTVMTSTKLNGGPEQPLHAAIVSQLGDKIAAVLMWTIRAMGILIHFLQSNKIGLVAFDELPDLL